jgi:hypothetical protein
LRRVNRPEGVPGSKATSLFSDNVAAVRVRKFKTAAEASPVVTTSPAYNTVPEGAGCLSIKTLPLAAT